MSQQQTRDISIAGYLAILAVFFFSGVAGLLYEVAWFRRLQTLAAGFYTLEHFGIRGTIWLGAALNVIIAILALLWSYHDQAAWTTTLPEIAETRGQPTGSQSLETWKVMLVVGLTGLVSMALEVVWTRALVFYVHNSTYAFSAIVAVYLLGLGLDAFGRVDSHRIQNPPVPRSREPAP